jgi:hypothetical protein
MKTASLYFLSFLILVFFCSTALGKNKLRTKDTCVIPTPGTFAFNYSWDLRYGYGEITFQGKGSDAYIRINNQMNDSSHQYWIVISGWGNTWSRVARGDGSDVCWFQQNLDLTRTYNYKFVLNPSASRIKLLLDDVEAWSCVDPNGWNAPNALYFSLSRAGSDMSFCNIFGGGHISEPVNTCFVPNPSGFTFDNKWIVQSGEMIHMVGIFFNGYGHDIYIRLSNQPDDSSYQYWVVLGGWNNTTSAVFRGDGSLVCYFNQSLDLTRTVNYNLIFYPEINMIEFFVDRNVSAWRCTDSKGYNANGSTYFGVSRWNGAFSELCDVETYSDMTTIHAIMLSKTVR